MKRLSPSDLSVASVLTLYVVFFIFALHIVAFSELSIVVKDYQTLISSFIALAAAGWTINTMHHQIRADHQRHEELLQRKAWAARAQMPDALVGLIEFAETCFRYLSSEEADFPTLPADAINVFKSSIEFLDNASAEKIFEMVSFYQVHNSRLEGHSHRDRPHGYNDRVYDLVLLNHYFLRTFEYARRETETIDDGEPTRQDMLASLRSLVGHERYFVNRDAYADLERHIELMHPVTEAT